jgi:hypothetical protein
LSTATTLSSVLFFSLFAHVHGETELKRIYVLKKNGKSGVGEEFIDHIVLFWNSSEDTK